MVQKNAFRAAILSATALVGVWGTPGFAQTAPADASADVPADPAADSGDVIIVTGTRRSVSIQDAPVNITALSAERLKENNVNDLRGLAAFTPGITIQDTGPRNTGTVVLRGLNATDTSSIGNNNDSAVATYIGEVPLYLDLKLLDIQRVETLLGPQGTLYGAGTLAGAIRYIPNRPDPNKWSGTAHGKLYAVAHSDSPGFQMDGTVNIPIVPGKIALRSTVGYYNDPGFIDYTYLLNQPGTSLPQPQASGVRFGQIGTPRETAGAVSSFYGSIGTADQVAANLHTYKDANFEHTFTTRNQLGLFPTDGVNIYLTYAYQHTTTNGRQANGGGVLGTGKYEAPWRYLEPSDRKAHLFAGEIEAELGDIAQLVSSTSYSIRDINSSSDVTDLLLDLDYNYELFPAFSGFTDQKVKYKQFTQEVRLVSTHGGPFSWIVGGFYNSLKYHSDYQEIVPGLGVYYFGPDIFNANYPREVEYASIADTRTTEKAVYGEGTFKITDAWQVTAGGRYFGYNARVLGGIALPLLGDVPTIAYDGLLNAQGQPDYKRASKNGFIWKFNTSYKFSPDLMVYATASKGYRIGGPNRVAPCPADLTDIQNACALPNELFYGPDQTYNKEIGIRSTLFGGKFNFNLAAYHILWKGIQLASATVNGATGITVNGGAAVSKGVELTFWAKPTRRLTIQGNYSYTDAHLTQDVPDLLDYRNFPGNRDMPGTRPKSIRIAAQAGDRLPGSMRHSGSLGLTYTAPAPGGEIVANWTATYVGDIVTRPGGRAYGETLPDYIVNRASIAYRLNEGFEVRLYADNIFDKYAVTSVGNDLSRRTINDYTVSRYYSNNVLSPRKVGVELTKTF